MSLKSTETTPPRRDEQLALGFLYVAVYFFLFSFWFFKFGDYLYVVREHSLFPPTFFEFRSALSEPAGALDLCALLFVALFQRPFVGACATTLLTFVLQRALYSFWRAPNERGKFTLFYASLVPCFLANYLFVNSGANIFSSNYGSFYLEPAIALLVILTVALLLRRVKSSAPRRALGTAILLVSYPAIGAFSFALAFLFLSDESLRAKTNDSIPRLKIARVVLLASAVAISPVLWGLFLWPGRAFPRLYRAALVDESTVTLLSATFVRQNVALFALFSSIVFGSFLSRRLWLSRAPRAKARSTSSRQSSDSDVRKTRDAFLVAFVFSLFCCAALYFLAPRDENFCAQLRIARLVERGDWEGVLKAEAKVRKPQSSVYCFRDLALIRLGRFAERLFDRPRSFQEFYEPRDAKLRVDAYRLSGETLLDAFGVKNMAARTATNNYVATRGRSVPAHKALAIAALSSGDVELAERWLRRLDSSLCVADRRWAKEIRRRASDGANEAFYVLPTSDRIETGIMSPFHILLSSFAARDDLVASAETDDAFVSVLETRLCYALIDSDFDAFKRELIPYWELRSKSCLPKSFQEAALFLERAQNFSIEPSAIDPEIRARFDEFTKYLQLYQRTRDPELLDGIAARYNDTAWRRYILAEVE